MSDALTGFLEGAVRTATPLALAAVGELVVQRAGVINLGLEGAIIMGAFAGVWGASVAGVGAGFAAGAVAGCLMALVVALFVVRLRADAIITGTAVSILGLGLTGTLYRVVFGESGAALSVPTIGPLAVPGLDAVPVLRAFVHQPVVTYLLYALVPALAWWLGRTHAGLGLRAVGESMAAARAAGISPARVRTAALAFGGVMGGVAGATLVLAQVGTFTEGMSAGRGYIAIAIVVLGRWGAPGVGAAALLFGGAYALQYLFQAMGWQLPYQLFLALPYVLTLVALAALRGRAVAPAGLGAADDGG